MGDRFKKGYIDLINRGGLVTPSDLVNVTCAHAVQLKQLLFDGKDLQELFLTTEYPQRVFVQTFVHLLKNEIDTELIVNQKCESGHSFGDFVPKIGNSVFNIFSKNFVSDENDKIHQARKRKTKEEEEKKKQSPTSKKIAKLQSDYGL